MLVLTARIGNGCFVYDSDDGSVEFIQVDDAFRLAANGVAIFGVNAVPGVIVPAPQHVHPGMCNFGSKDSTGKPKNVFHHATNLLRNSDYYVLVSDGKKFKFKVVGDDIVFTNGLSCTKGIIYDIFGKDTGV